MAVMCQVREVLADIKQEAHVADLAALGAKVGRARDSEQVPATDDGTSEEAAEEDVLGLAAEASPAASEEIPAVVEDKEVLAVLLDRGLVTYQQARDALHQASLAELAIAQEAAAADDTD